LNLLYFIQFFLLGFLLADLYLTQWRESSARQGWWDAVGLFGWISMMAVWVFIPEPRIIFPALALLASCAAFRGNIVRRVLSNRWLTTVGGMCYSIYLLHYPLISALGRHSIGVGSTLPFAGHLLAQVMTVVPLLLLVSTAYFVLIERPCMNKDWPARLARRVRLAHGGPSHRDVAPVLPETPGVGSAPGTVTRA
jgi:peptidoglycan/LPS O-acetylase OafA/YrhL